MTLPNVRSRRFPYLQRRELAGRGASGGAVSQPECNVVADTDNVIANGDNVIVFKCDPFTVIVDEDNVIVEGFEIIVGL